MAIALGNLRPGNCHYGACPILSNAQALQVRIVASRGGVTHGQSSASVKAVATGIVIGIVMKGSRTIRRKRPSSFTSGARDSMDGASIACRAEAEVMQSFVSACSMERDWNDAVEGIGAAVGSGQYESGLAFISEAHVTVAQGIGPVLEALRKRLGLQTLIGCVSGGGIGQGVGPRAAEYGGVSADGDWPPIEVERGAFLSVGLLRSSGATPFFLGRDGEGDLELLGRQSAEGNIRSILLLSDPFASLDDVLRRLDDKFPKAVKVGGISALLQVGGDERQAFEPSIAIAAEGCQVRLLSQGVVGILLSDFDIHTIVCQGCRGVGPPVKITSVRDNIVTGIGGRPASEAVRYIFSAVDPPTREKMQKFLTAGLGSVGQDSNMVGDGDWLIRMITGVSPEGGLVIGDGVSEGQPLRFHVRDRESAESDLALMMKRYRLERTFGPSNGPPAGCFLFTCNGRGEGLYGRRHVDARAVAETLGDAASTRVAGFFCNGEIGAPGLAVPGSDSAGVGKGAVHGFTAVYALLFPAS